MANETGVELSCFIVGPIRLGQVPPLGMWGFFRDRIDSNLVSNLNFGISHAPT